MARVALSGFPGPRIVFFAILGDGGLQGEGQMLTAGKTSLPVLLSAMLACSGLAVNVQAGHHSHSHSHSHPHSHPHSGGEHSDSGGHRGHHFSSSISHRRHGLGNSNAVPGEATAECSDGTYSFNKNEQDACFNHGGVKRWLR